MQTRRSCRWIPGLSLIHILELLFEKLKAVKERLAEDGDGTPVQRLTAFIGEVREEYEGKKQAGLLTRAQIHQYEDVCGTMDQYILAAGEAEAQDGEALFGMLAARFGEEREQYEDQCRACCLLYTSRCV